MPLARTRAVRRPSATNPMSRPTTSAAMALLVYAVMTPETSARHVPVHQAPARPRRVAGTAGDPLERLPRRGRRRGPGARCRAAAQAIQRYRAAQSRAPADRPGLEDGGPRHGPTMNVRGPEMAPHTPQRSERPGKPVG